MLCVFKNVVYSIAEHSMLYFGNDFRMRSDGVNFSSIMIAKAEFEGDVGVQI